MYKVPVYFLLLLLHSSIALSSWVLERGSGLVYEPIFLSVSPGESSPNNAPGARLAGATWTDSSDNVWIFSGLRQTNDLWKFENGAWTLMKGFPFPAPPVYGVQGISSEENLPGAREHAGYAAIGDSFYVFGGFGRAVDGVGYLNDLWRYEVATNEWTFVSGNETRNAGAFYGSLGISGADNFPGSREASTMSADSNGVLYLFGGWGYDTAGNLDIINDLWSFSVASSEWTWLSGSDDSRDAVGSFGTLGEPSPTNVPNARYWPTSWVNSEGKFFLFGGVGWAQLEGDFVFGYLNDLWSFSASEWTWLGGSQFLYEYSTVVTEGTLDPGNFPGARCLMSSTVDRSGNMWMFGGYGGSLSQEGGHLNELWKYEGGEWALISGSEEPDQAGFALGEGISAEENLPGSRYGHGLVATSSNLWISSGYGYDLQGEEGFLGDLWRYYLPIEDSPNVCGDGEVQEGEECDGGICCLENCTFSPSSTVCRTSRGECDVEEYCSGSSAQCPLDQFVAFGEPCGELVGFCDVLTQSSCSGNTPQCNGPPRAPAYYGAFGWENYNVISFSDFVGNGGSIEGRVAVKRNAQLSSFSIGSAIDSSPSGTDVHVPFSLIVGQNASWTSGSLLPAPDTRNPLRNPEYAFIGDTFTAPAYLQERQWNAYPEVLAFNSSANFDVEFSKAQTYYSLLSDKFASFENNVEVEELWGGLFLRCSNPSEQRYVATVDGAIFGRITWYSLEGCKFDSEWILNIVGSGNVVLQGGQLPVIVERAIYNIRGSGRNIRVVTGVQGNILSPFNDFEQPNGVTHGLVVVGNVLSAKSARNPRCFQFQHVTITSQTSSGSVAGQSEILVNSLSQLNIGDEITFQEEVEEGEDGLKRGVSEVKRIIGARKEGNQTILILDSPLENSWPEETFFFAAVENPTSAQREPFQFPTTPDEPSESDEEPSNSPSSSEGDDEIPSDPSEASLESGAVALTASFFASLVVLSFVC